MVFTANDHEVERRPGAHVAVRGLEQDGRRHEQLPSADLLFLETHSIEIVDLLQRKGITVAVYATSLR